MVKRTWWLRLAVVGMLLAATLWRVEAWLDNRAALDSGYLLTELLPEDARPWDARAALRYDRWRGRLLFHRIAREATAGSQTDRDRLDRLLAWTYLHVRPASWAAPSRVHFDDPYRTVKRGFGFCDQSAHVFAELARASDFEARLYFLVGARGDSPHTVAQVLLNGKWILVDTLAGRLLEADGTPLTIDVLRQHPELLEKAYEGVQPRLLAVTADDFIRGRVAYGGAMPWRRVPETPLSGPEFPVEASESVLAYDKFRQAMLDGDWTRSEALYEELGRMPLQGELAQAAAYHAVLAAFEAGHWERAVARAHQTLSSDPDTPWRSSYFELMGLANERLGNMEAVLEGYAAADLPSARIRAQRLVRAR